MQRVSIIIKNENIKCNNNLIFIGIWSLIKSVGTKLIGYVIIDIICNDSFSIV